MPGHLTHDFSYFDLYKKLPAKMQEQYADAWPRYRIFAQGHDLLLFYMFLHLPQYPALQSQGELIEENIQGLAVNYASLLRETGKTDEAWRCEARLFLYGYLIHHFLDAKLHPLIIYETGDLRRDKKAQALHLLVENQIDAYMLQKDGVDPGKFVMQSIVPSKNALSAETRELVRKSFQETYGLENFDEIFANYNQMSRTFYKTLRYDPHGIKKTFFKPLDVLLFGLFKPSILPFRFDGTECLEYLNLDKQSWTHPIDAGIISNKSFDELYEESVNEMTEMIGALDEAVADRASDEELKSIVPNISSIHGQEAGIQYQFDFTKGTL